MNGLEDADDVTQCLVCRRYFTQGIEGDGVICDACLDAGRSEGLVERIEEQENRHG